MAEHTAAATPVRGWEDLSALLPASRGWMHSGVAVLSDGRIACAHPEGGSVLLIDPAGRTTSAPTGLTELHGIVATTRGGTEALAVADPGHRFVEGEAHAAYVDHVGRGRAVILSVAGTLLLELDCPALRAYSSDSWRPTSIAVDDERFSGSGDIYVADGYGASLIHRFDADGTHLATFDGAATGLAFACPHGIMLRRRDSATEIYVADRTNRRIVVIDTTGAPLRVIGLGDLDSPSSMALADDRLYVTELFGGVARFDGDRFSGTLGAGRTRSSDEDDWPNERSRDGLTGPVVAPGAFNSPHGISTDGEWLYITEWYIGGRLSRLSLEQY